MGRQKSSSQMRSSDFARALSISSVGCGGLSCCVARRCGGVPPVPCPPRQQRLHDVSILHRRRHCGGPANCKVQAVNRARASQTSRNCADSTSRPTLLTDEASLELVTFVVPVTPLSNACLLAKAQEEKSCRSASCGRRRHPHRAAATLPSPLCENHENHGNHKNRRNGTAIGMDWPREHGQSTYWRRRVCAGPCIGKLNVVTTGHVCQPRGQRQAY